MSFLQIPGNIKHQFIPFVINPKSHLSDQVNSSSELNGKMIAPQFFSYRDAPAYSSGNAHLQFYPTSLNKILINDDISLKLLYARQEGIPTNESLTISDILNCIPGISIREFLPDTRLDQCINMFTDLIGNMAKLFAKDESASTSTGNSKQKSNDDDSLTDKLKKIGAAVEYTLKYMTGCVDPNFFSDLLTDSDYPFANYNVTSKATSQSMYVMQFPYTLYYRLQSCMTTNVYEVPASTSDKRILVSSGKAGWTDGGSDLMSSGGFRLSGLLSKIPAIGSIANMILGNIGINYMPWWNAETGSKTPEPEISMKFDLFNDSAQAALMNFIFVNTIVPNNKWLQYNMFQHSSCLYDVKIEGVNRLFACAGDFNVTYEGVLRDPPKSFIRLLSEHLNPRMDKTEFENSAITNKLIKIPDVYRVELKFQSLLPANFNNFLFTYAQNINHMDKYDNKVYEPSEFSNALPKAIGKYAERVKKVYDSGNVNANNSNSSNK